MKHYHCPVNAWDCPTIQIFPSLANANLKTPMKNVIISQICSMNVKKIFAKKITKTY